MAVLKGLAGVLCAFVVLSAGMSAAEPLQAAGRPNVVILFADDMGYGDLSCFGHPTIRTPNLDRMAQEGMRLTSFYVAAPVCTPSRVGLLTGRYPIRAGQPGNTGPGKMGGLPLTEILIPQVLKPLGYKTMIVGKWHLGYQPEEYLPYKRGFDHWYGLPYSNDHKRPFVDTDVPLWLYRDSEKIEYPVVQETLTERYTDEAIKFIKASKGSPFFLYVPYAMPHLPVSASGKFRVTSRAGLYGDVIETIDYSAGRILETLQSEGLDDNTLVIFTSDNGPWLNLPDRMLQDGNEWWHTGSPSLLNGAKGTTYEGGHRVPFIARWPGTIPPRQISSDIVSSLDIFPMVVKAAGGDVPQDRTMDGSDILPFLQGQSASPRKEFFYCVGKNLQAVREGPWKYREVRNVIELYHLDRDPAEKYNVAERYTDIAARLQAKLESFKESVHDN
jgi:arylsulfatase A